MKLAYILNYLYRIPVYSVMNKVISQLIAIEKAGVEPILYIFSEEKGVEEIIDIKKFKQDFTTDLQKATDYYYHKKSIGNRILINYRNINNLVVLLKKSKPDIIYLRDCGYQFNLHRELSKIAPLFVEIQTKFIDELGNWKSKRYYLERFLKRNYLKHAQGLICVTDEIAQYELSFNDKPYFILGNGIDEDEICYIERIKEGNENDNLINLLFLGSPNLPWHGIDRLVRSFLKAPNKEKFYLHIVGYEDVVVHDKNIKCYGYIKDKKVINKLIAKSDIGIGTLALFRKKMNEAAPLKVREYLAKGLPVIIGYDDVDLNEGKFVYKVSNDDSDIDFMEIEKFYNEYARNFRYNVKGINTTVYARNNLSWSIKMKKVIEFIQESL